MLPAIARMIAGYGTGRLLNDGLKRHPDSPGATAPTWFIAIVAIVGLWYLAMAINRGALSPSDLP